MPIEILKIGLLEPHKLLKRLTNLYLPSNPIEYHIVLKHLSIPLHKLLIHPPPQTLLDDPPILLNEPIARLSLEIREALAVLLEEP